MATPVLTINARYQISGKPIAQGGMGLVYKAYDTVTRRYVALKTMKGPLNAAALELFSKEWSVLARLSHPNIVDILDTGELEEGGQRRPYFVMPFLPGVTLDQLIRNSSQRLTVERVVDIISQACRGLQAAHEQGLIHRDLKPSNIFVMEDDTVKVIDFGVVHLAGVDSVTGIKGTIQYMAPEQIEMKPISSSSDIFSLSVVCYEALTSRKPFWRRTDAETADAVRRHIPPPASELNPLVPQMVSRVVHKGMAKAQWHRFSSAREYGEALQRARNNQPIERFDRAKLQPRIERAKKAQAEGDLQFASEILTELEAEGNIDPDMSLLRIQIDHAIRQKSIRQLIDSVRTRMEEEEFPLALQKIQEVLEIDPENADALSLRGVIEKQRSARQLDNWFRLVDQHVHNRAFAQARQALREVLKIDAANVRACELMLEVDRREQEISRLWAEKDQLYQSALSAYQHGEISSALTKLERILTLTCESPDSALPERDAQYQSLYNQIRSEREAARSSYAEGRQQLADRNFGKALEICAEYLNKSPGDPMFQALKLEVEEQQRQDQSSFIAEVSRRAEAEPDLDRRVDILKEAAERCPNEAHFQQSLRLIRERRDLVNSIVAKARQYEERSQFNEALSQWDILRNIYPQYPGLEFEIERVVRRRDGQARQEAKGRWVEQIDRQIASGDYLRARDLAHTALSEFPDDRELIGLERLAQQALERSAEAEVWLQRGQQMCFDRQFGEGLEALRKASALDNRNPVIRAALLNALLEQARSVLGQDWRAAEPLIQQALSIEGNHPLAKNLQGLILDYKHQEIVTECISMARELQAANDLPGAIAKVEEVLAKHPNEVRLVQLRSTLRSLSTAGAGPPEAKAASTGDAPQVVRHESATRADASLDPIPNGAFTEMLDASALRGAGTAALPQTHTVPPGPQENQAAAVPPLSAPGPQWGAMVGQARARAGWLGAHLQGLTVARGRFSPLQWLVIGFVPVILLAAFLFPYTRRTRAVVVPVPPPDYLVSLASNVLGTQFEVDDRRADQPMVRLTPGLHTVKAFAPGYKRAEQKVAIERNARNVPGVEFRLEPEPVGLRLSSDIKSGQVLLDDRPISLPDTGFLDETLATGAAHTMVLRQNARDLLTLTFRAEPGGVTTVSALTSASYIDTLVIASLGARAQVYSGNRVLKAGLKGDPPQVIPKEGLALDLARGTELVLDDGQAPRSVPIESGDAPRLTIQARNDVSLGWLSVECNVPDARIVIAGQQARTMKTGRMQLPLSPGRYAVRVEHADYVPEDRTIEVKKGGPAQALRIDLQPVKQTASVIIEGGTGGAEVYLGETRLGVSLGNGAFESAEIPPGAHAITLKKAYHEDKTLPVRSVAAGQQMRISRQEAELVPWGKVHFGVTPASATLTYRRLEEATTHRAENGTDVPLKQGRYVLSAAMTGRIPKTDEVTIDPGKTFTFDGTLASANTTPPKPDPVLPASPETVFKDPHQWTKDSQGWWIHRGSSLALLQNEGVYEIEIGRPGKHSSLVSKIVKNKTEWNLDYADDNNRLEYTLDENGTLERKAHIGGSVAGSSPKKKLAPGRSDIVHIEIRPDRLVVQSGEFQDSYPRTKPGAPLGSFAFKGDVAIRLIRYPSKLPR